jgi:hypothetical protein
MDGLIYWEVSSTPLGIQITCRGHDKARTVGTAVATFQKLTAEREGQFCIVADLREMTGYETEARVAWQEALRRQRQRIESIVFVGARSALIRMGAAAVGAFSGIPVRFVHGWSEVPAAMKGG